MHEEGRESVKEEEKLALALLKNIKQKELKLKEVIAMIELISKSDEFSKNVLKKAEEEKIIKRERNYIRIISSPEKEEKIKIRKKLCNSACKRCGKSIRNCHYLYFPFLEEELGPYGSKCVRMLKQEI